VASNVVVHIIEFILHARDRKKRSHLESRGNYLGGMLSNRGFTLSVFKINSVHIRCINSCHHLEVNRHATRHLFMCSGGLSCFFSPSDHKI
jgi:hypothetical protein